MRENAIAVHALLPAKSGHLCIARRWAGPVRACDGTCSPSGDEPPAAERGRNVWRVSQITHQHSRERAIHRDGPIGCLIPRRRLSPSISPWQMRAIAFTVNTRAAAVTAERGCDGQAKAGSRFRTPMWEHLLPEFRWLSVTRVAEGLAFFAQSRCSRSSTIARSTSGILLLCLLDPASF